MRNSTFYHGVLNAAPTAPESFTTTVDLSNNTFRNCHCTSTSEGFGGALFVRGGTLVCRWSLFESCSAFSGGAIGVESATLVLCGCAITACMATCPAYPEKLGIEANQYDGRRPNGGGGALWIQTDGNITVTGCLFKSCHAPSFGGGIMLWPYVPKLPTDIKINNLVFLDTNSMIVFFVFISFCFSYNILKRQIWGHNTQDYLVNTANGKIARMRGIFTDTVLGGYNIHQVQIGTSGYLSNALATPIDSDVFVAAEGQDAFNCGYENRKCRTVSFGANKVKSNQKVIIKAGQFNTTSSDAEKCILVNDRTVTVQGDGKYVPDTSGTQVVFDRPSYLETANVKVTTGSFSATKITMEFTSCDFSSITSNLGTGAAIHATLQPSASFIVSDSSFSSCSVGSAADSRGAALYLFTEDGAADFDLKTLTFSENTASAGQDIYINSADVDSNLTPAKFIAEWTNDATDNARFVCFSRGGTYSGVEQGIPECFLSMAIFVDETGTDIVGCGKTSDPCISLTFAAEQKGMDLSGFVVLVVDVGILNGSVDASGTTIQPNSGLASAQLRITTVSSLSTTQALRITNITFLFSVDAASATPLLSVSPTGSLSLTNVAFSASSLLTAPILLSVVSGGTITANSFSVSSLKFSSAVVSIATSSINIGDIHVTECTYTGSLSTPLLSVQLTTTATAEFNVGSITFDTLTTPPTSDSSKLTLAVIEGTSSTEITSKTTLLTASSRTFSSNTALSFSGPSSAPVALLTMELGLAFSLSVSSSSVMFAASTSATTTALADTTASSLALSSTTINLSNLDDFFATALFTVPANNLVVTQATLSSPLLGNAQMTTPFVVVSGGTVSLTNIILDGSVLATTFAHSMLKQTAGSLILNTCAFNSISTSDEGAAIKASLNAGQILSLTGVTFTSCSSLRNGGALHVTVEGGSFTTTAPITFTDCSATGKGNALFLSSPSLSSIVDPTALLALKPTLPATKADTDVILNVFYGFESASLEGSLLYLWFPHTTGDVFVHSAGENHASCGLVQLPCQTLLFGNERMKETGKQIVLSADISLSEVFTTRFALIKITSENTAKSIACSSSAAFVVDTAANTLTLDTLAIAHASPQPTSPIISVSNGKCVLNAVEFGSSSLTTTVSTSLISVTGGTLEANDVKIQKFVSISSSLIEIAGGLTTLSVMQVSLIQSQSSMITQTAGNLVLQDCEFSGVKNTGGNGSVLHASVGTGQSLRVSDGKMTDCSSSGCGGALFVRLSGTGSFTLDGISGTEFSGCSSTLTGQCVTLQLIADASGFSFNKVQFPSSASSSNPVPFLLIDADSLKPIIKRSRFLFLSPFELTSDHGPLYSGFKGGEISTQTPLYPYLLTSDACGSQPAPCITLGQALNERTKSPPSDEETGYELVVIDSGRIDASFDVGDYVLKVTSKTKTTLVFSNNAKFTMNAKSTPQTDFTLSNLILSWNGPATTLVTQTKGKLNILNVELSTIGDVIFTGNLIDTTSSTVTFSQLTLNAVSKKVGQRFLSPVTFTSCSSAGNGGCLNVIVEGTGTLQVQAATFEQCSSLGNGGAISVALTTGTFTADASTSFAGCSAVCGGAIAVDLTGRTDPGTFTLSGVQFGTSSNTATKGSDIFVLTASGGRSYLTPARFGNSHPNKPSSGTFFGTADLNKWYFVDSEPVEGSILYLLYPYKGGTLNVHSSSPANDLCGHVLLPCNSLNVGNRLVHSTTASNADDACIALLSDVSVSTAITSTSTVEWKSDSTRRTVSLSADVGVTVDGGSLTVSDLTLTVTSFPFSTSFFTLSGGSLSVESSEFSSISTTGEGSAIKAVLNTGQTLSLSDVAFIDCMSQTTGGALHVTVEGGSFSTAARITFTDCSATGKGNALFLSSPSLSSIVDPTALLALKPTLPATKADTDVILNYIYGFESASLEGSLLYLWFPHTIGDVFVHSAGENHANCGLVQLPCQTLVFAHERVKESGKRIVLSSETSLSEVFTTRLALLTITSENTAKSIACSSSAAFVVDTAANTLTLDTLAIAHATPQPTSPIISVSNGKCVLNAVEFGSSSRTTTVSTSLISVSGGTLEANDVKIQKFVSISSSLIVVAGGSSTLSGMKVSLIQSQSAMISQTAGNLVIEGSEFLGVTNTGGNGSVLHASVGTGQSLRVSDGKMTDCSSSGCGGALFVRLSGTGSFTLDGISGTEFSGCSSTLTGQCVTLQLIADASGFSFNKVQFPSSASSSNPVPFLLIDADSLKPIIKRPRFLFLSPFELTSHHELLFSGFEGGDTSTKIPLSPMLVMSSNVIHVSSTGNDDGTGTSNNPLKSLRACFTLITQNDMDDAQASD
ncbi:hypothetical protein BLNAU_13543 [Blattamonas nauphoetae]|uniref:Uncharacterized protein n=1 Tax=Blattamonas nauphoetae TaxID=2049346 RepID=A0ABQ9XMN5_9EUKA|nr:hypothetical protein BLNAU_13543 [Blattamonas nauphoetae]